MKILLPVDGSVGALDAVRHTLRLLQGGLRASVVVVNVQEPASLYEVVVAHDAAVIEAVSQAAAAHVLAPAEALLRDAAIEFETEVGHGDPAHVLGDIAERTECDLIVVGARGQDAGEGRAIGSVAMALLQRAAAPVTVVHPATPGARR